ncbi:uncharacterized protein LOC108995543 [Juglans regia]|nr:uncharacterized protein LOC108995543 [Juglans regia]
MEGIAYRVFHWTPEFKEEEESPIVPVWISLPGLPPNYFHGSILKSIGGGFGRILKCDNATACVTHPEVAQIYVELDLSKPLQHHFWLGPPSSASSHYQEVVYESILLFCNWCRTQGHLEQKCVHKKKSVEKGKSRVVSKDGDRGHLKQSWKVVGEKKRMEGGEGARSVMKEGDLLSKEQFSREITSVEQKERSEFVEWEVLNQDEPNVRNHIGSSMELQHNSESWFEQSEKRTGQDVSIEILDGFPSPRSSLKITDEELEFELCGVADSVVDGGERMMAFDRRNVHSLSEKEDEGEIEELAAKCYESDNAGGKTWLFWADGIDFQLISAMDQALSVSCDVEVDGCPWFLGRDFNIICTESEKIGGIFQSSHAIREFNNCIQECGLLDLPSSGQRFSWCNGRLGSRRIWARLDRILVNTAFMLRFGDGQMIYLSRTSSDHCPMVAQLNSIRRSGAWLFRFQRMWCTHENSLNVVREYWLQEVPCCPMIQMSIKLKKLKQVLKKWNREVFGKVESKIKMVEAELVGLEDMVINNYSREADMALLTCKQKHLLCLHREEIMSCQKSRMKWLSEGDLNTAFFHASMKCKKKNKMVDHMELEDGSSLESVDAVHEGAGREPFYGNELPNIPDSEKATSSWGVGLVAGAWLKPRRLRLMLNIDRSSLGNPGAASGGVIIREAGDVQLWVLLSFMGPRSTQLQKERPY